MTVTEIVRVPEDKPWATDLNRVIDAVILGNDGSQIKHKGWDGVLRDPNLGTTLSSTNFTHIVQNNAGYHSLWRNSADTIDVATMTDSGLSVIGLVIAGDLTVPGNLIVGGNSTLGNAIGDTTAISGPATIGGTLGVTGISTLGVLNAGNTTVGTLGAGVTTVTSLTATGNTSFGDANTDIHLRSGVTTFQNVAGTTIQAHIDSANNRVIFGTTTPMPSDTVPAVHHVGRAYFAPETANDFAIQVRRSAAASVGWSLGMTSDDAFVFKDDASVEAFRVGDSGATYQAKVTGDFNVTDDVDVGGDLAVVSRLAVATSVLVASSALGSVGFGTASPSSAVVAHFNGLIRLDGSTSGGKVSTGLFWPIVFNGTTFWLLLYS